VAGPEAFGLLGELRAALEAGELVCHYQPTVALGDGSWVGAEALVRWPHPTRGLLLPERFLPVAARAGLLAPLGRHVLTLALAQAAAWRAAGRPLPVAVNLTADDLADPRLLERLRQGLEAAGLPPDQLTVELPEAAISADVPRATAVLRAVRLLGVRVSLDEFGSGASCLAHLDALPIDELKLHRSFVQRGLAGGDGTVLAAVVRLGHELGLEVVAEGIDAADLLARVAELGCDLAQGLHLAPPVPAAALLGRTSPRAGKWLNNGSRTDVVALAGRGAPR
jgi:EAL domain-containing protein (putative c-di-GMP-specific phosphodiesterase class I)